MNVPSGRDPRYRGLRSAGLLLAIPTLLIVAPLVGFFLGNWLDKRFHTYPWLMLAGLLLGFVAAYVARSSVKRSTVA